MAVAAASLPVPQDVRLKDPANFTLIGTELPKPDSYSKSHGEAVYTLDLRSPDMVVAMVARPDRFGAKAISVDDTAVRAKGYLGHAILPQGVAVFATSTWPALKARQALRINWDESEAHKTGTAAIEKDYVAQSSQPGVIAARRGDAAGKLASGNGDVIEQVFVFPYLAQAPMETLDASSSSMARPPNAISAARRPPSTSTPSPGRWAITQLYRSRRRLPEAVLDGARPPTAIWR